MKEEKTKVKDEISLYHKTECVPISVPMRDIPQSRVFDIKVYRDREWVLLFMDKKLFDEIKELCDKRKLDVKKVLYGMLIDIKDRLGGV